jgi:branched-subunit amino acid transport protein
MNSNVYLYILVMALVTYMIRARPLVLIRREIKSRFIRSFLYYVPFATLAAMTFPSILTATDMVISAVIGFATALILAFAKKSLIVVAIGASCVVLIVETLVGFM